MARVFHRSTNTLSRVSIFGFVFLLVALSWVTITIGRSAYLTNVGVAQEQPVPFSHEHHVSGLGIDCRYCHTSVEQSSFAGIPPTKTCMTCHSQIWTNAPMLEPVRQSWNTDRPIVWNRVNNLPGFVYFNHSIHVAKGVGCNTCHGPVDQMPLTFKTHTSQMSFCMDCHQNPQHSLRPQDQVFNMAWQPPANQDQLGLQL